MKYYLIYVIGQLCFYVYVKLFLHEGMLDSEINISGFPLLDVAACLELVVESVCMYPIQQLMTYV